MGPAARDRRWQHTGLFQLRRGASGLHCGARLRGTFRQLHRAAHFPTSGDGIRNLPSAAATAARALDVEGLQGRFR